MRLLKPSIPAAAAGLCLLFAGTGPATAQLDALRKAVAPGNGAAQEEKTESDADRLKRWVKEARAGLARLEDPTTIPPGIAAEEVEAFRIDLQQTERIAGRPEKLTGSSSSVSRALERSRQENAAWKGFEDGPPESMLALDELHNQRDASNYSLSSQKSALANFEALLTSQMDEAKKAEANLNHLLGQTGGEDGTDLAARWRVDAARAASRLAALRVRNIQSNIEVIREKIATIESDLALLDRKIDIASRSARLSEDDLQKIARKTEEYTKSIGRKAVAVSKRLQKAAKEREAVVAELAKLESAETVPDEAVVEGLRGKRDHLVRNVDDLEEIEEVYEAFIAYEERWKECYNQRFIALNAKSAGDRDEALDHLRLSRERAKALVRVTDDEAASISAEIAKLESQAASTDEGDPGAAYLDDRRALIVEKIEAMRELREIGRERQRILGRWIRQIAPEEDEVSLGGRITGAAGKAWDFVRKVWSFEITHFDEVEINDGLQNTRRVPLTLGMVLRALVFFALAYFIATRFANRIEATLVGRRKMDGAHARNLRNWVMLGVAVSLGFATLAILKIPLTVFALFGGALAIGLGFGTQTLIKNFISGIIVLIERKVRVGDIIDADGSVGTVTEVNARSSVIRAFNGVETVIPNSVFLENRFTNWTLSNNRIRREIRIGVAYGTPPKLVIETIHDEAVRHGLVCKDPEPMVIFEDFGDSALVFCLYYWFELQGSTNGKITDSDLRIMIEKRFNEMKIGIPFPQRDVHLSSDAPLEVRISKEEAEVSQDPQDP